IRLDDTTLPPLGADLMRGIPGFSGRPATAERPRPKRLPAERRRPELELLRALKAGDVRDPISAGGLFSGPMGFPAGRLWLGRWPHVQLLASWPRPEAETAAPTIGIVIPAHNAADHIAKTIASICPGLGAADRIVVIENGSRDATWELLQTIARDDE